MRESDKALAHTGMTRTANSLIRRLPRPGSIRGEAAGAWVDLILIVFGLAVVGIGALIYLSSLPHRCCDSPSNRRNACIANLKQIEGAKSTWALEFAKGTNDVPVAADLFGPSTYIERKPDCPERGTYILGKVGDVPKCSVAGHQLDAPPP